MRADFSFSGLSFEVGELLVKGTSNWDIYALESFDSKKAPCTFSVAKPNSGCGTTYFGSLNHIVNLIREDHMEGDFTEYGRDLMVKYGYEKYLKDYETLKDYKVTFYDGSRVYGKITREVTFKVKCRSEAYDKAYEIIDRTRERDLIVQK